jgi:hypothetical protein
VAAHTLIHDEAAQPRAPRARRSEYLQLGWLHFWMLAGILGGILSLVAMVFLIQLARS